MNCKQNYLTFAAIHSDYGMNLTRFAAYTPYTLKYRFTPHWIVQIFKQLITQRNMFSLLTGDEVEKKKERKNERTKEPYET